MDSAQPGVVALPLVSCEAVGYSLLSPPMPVSLSVPWELVIVSPHRVRTRTPRGCRCVAWPRAGPVGGLCSVCMRVHVHDLAEQRASVASDRPSAGELRNLGHLFPHL